jgi:3-methyladenine DNA glycosylase AlkD
MGKPTFSSLARELEAAANPAQAAILQRFFKTGPGQYGAGDIFLGLKVPTTRAIAKKYRGLPLSGVERLLASRFHEFRLAGLLLLVDAYEQADNLKEKKVIFRFYLDSAKQGRINNWDLVDLSAPNIVGDYLLESGVGTSILEKLALSSNLWERRIAIVSTFAFIKAGQSAEVFRLARQLLSDQEDLIHKAVGWMLREAGKRAGEEGLIRFLDKETARMPRTALRYAIERLRPEQRAHYLQL